MEAPAVGAMVYSPDGKYLAVGGYCEVVLHKSDGSGIATRLVGGSPRIESLAFSGDGKFSPLAAAPGAVWQHPGVGR